MKKKKHINFNVLRRVCYYTERPKIDASNDTAIVTILKQFQNYKVAKIVVNIH